MGSGNPTGVEGVDCSGGKTCFLSTDYGNGGDASNNGSTYVSHDGGHTWAPTTLPVNVATTTLVSCVEHVVGARQAAAWPIPKTGDPAAGKVIRDPELLMTSDGGCRVDDPAPCRSLPTCSSSRRTATCPLRPPTGPPRSTPSRAARRGCAESSPT